MAAEVGASAAAQQQIALPPEGADISSIQDEDLLRRMWQATEDFGRKKEIRARMYKLREQRLKEFYTTGEVLSDLMSTTLDSSTSATETSANNAGVSSTIVTTRRTTYAASESGDSVGGGGLVVTTETIRGGGGSQESLVIRYRSGGNEEENLKNIEMDRRQLQGSSELIYESGGKTTRSTRSTMSSSNNQSAAMITKSATYGLHSQSLADQGFLTMKSKEIRDSESPTRDFSHLHNRQLQHTPATHGGPDGGYWYEESRSYHTGDDGADVMQYGTRGGQQAYSSSSVIEYGDGGSTTLRTGDTALSSEQREQKSSSTKMEVSSSSLQEHSASSSSYSVSSSNRSTQDWIQKHQDDESFVCEKTQPLQIESVRTGGYEERVVKEKDSMDGTTSVHREQTSKTERVSETAENETRISKEETESRRMTTEKVDEVGTKEETRGPKQKVTQRSKTGELPLEVNITKQVTTEVISSVPSTATSTPLPDSGPTPDVGSWTVVSGKQNGVCSSTDEFVFRSGTTTAESTTRDTTQRITTSDSTTKEDSRVTLETQKTTPALSPSTAKPSYSMPTAGKPTPVDSPVTSPSVEVKSIMKQTTTTTTTTSAPQAPAPTTYNIQTKRISTEVSPTHEVFARSLRTSPEKTQTYTRASSKTSIDTNTTILSSPTRPQRTSVTSPTGRSSSPEKGSSRPRDKSSPMKQQTPSPSASKEKRKLSSSLSKGVGGKRTATPGASPTASPVRGRSPCTDDEETRRRVGTSPEKKKSTVTREGSPFSEPTRKSPAKETKSSTRKTPEKSPAREIPDSPQESPKQRKSSETTITKETKTTNTLVGRRPSKGPKDEKPVVRKPSTDRLSSPASSPMKDKSPEFPKEKKPGDDKTPTSPQRPKDLDLKTRPTSGTKPLTPSSPLDKTPTKPKDHDKPTEGKRRPSKDSTEPHKTSPGDKDGPKPHRILKADQPEEEFEVVCEAPETFDVTIITPIVHSVEYPTEEPEKKSPIKKTTTTEEDITTKKIVQELEIERIKKPSTIPGPIQPEEKDNSYQRKEKSPVSSEVKPGKDVESPRKPKDVYEDEPVAPRSKSPELRPTRKDSQPKKSSSKEALMSTKDTQRKSSPSPSRESSLRKESPSPIREAPKSPRRSPIRDSPVRDTHRRQSPSPSRDSPLRETKRPTSPVPSSESPSLISYSPTRKSPAKDSPRQSSPSPARDMQRKQSPSPARDMPSTGSPLRGSPLRDSPKHKSPSPAKESPKSYSPSRDSPARGSPSRDSPRKHSPAPTDDSPTRKPCTRDSPVREFMRKHSPSPAKESPERGYPRNHSPSPAKDSPMRKSPARDSPIRESPRKHSPSPARDSPTKRPVGKSPQKDGVRKSPTRDVPTKPSTERDSPFRRRPDEKPSPEKSPARKPSIKDSPRKESPARKTPERDTIGKSPVRQSPLRDTTNKTPDRETPKKAPTRPSPAKDAPKRDFSPKKPCEHEPPKKPTLTRKASEKDKMIPKKDTIARRSQSTEIPASKRASPFKDSPKTDDMPLKRAPAAESPTRKSPSKETPVRRIPQYSSPARQPTDSPVGESPSADKPWRQSPYKSPTKDTPPTETPAKPSGIPRTMSPARRPLTTDSLPSSPDSPRQKEGRPQTSTSSPEKSPPTQRPSRSPERAPARKPDNLAQKPGSKPISRIPGRAPASNITPPSQKRQAPTSSIPSYTSPLRRGLKDECCPHHHEDSPKAEPKEPFSRPQLGSRIPESNVRRPGESPIGRKPTKSTTTTTRKPMKPKKQRPFSGTESEEEDVSTSETDEDEKRECVEERVTVKEKEVRRVSEVFMQDMSKPQYPMQNGGFPDRPVSLSLITTSTKTVTSGEEIQQTIDSEGNVTTRTYTQPSTVTMSVSCKNTDIDGKEVTHTLKKTTYPDRPDEDEDVEIMEIDDDDFPKPMEAIEYPSDEEPLKRPSKMDTSKQVPTQGSPKRFGSPAKPIKKETKPQTTPGKRPVMESPVGRQPNYVEPAKKRIPATTASPSPKQPTTGRKTTPATKKPTQPIGQIPEEKTSPKSQRKPGQVSRLPAKQSPKLETKKIPTTTGKTTVQQNKTTVMSMVSSTSRQQSSHVSSSMQKTQPRQPLKGAPQPKQLKPAPKGKIPQKTGKGIPVKETKKRVTNGRVPYSEEPEDDEETEEEYDDKDSPMVSDVEKTEKYYTDEDTLVEEKVTDFVKESKITPKPTEEKPQGLHPSSAVSTVTGIQTTTEIRQVSRESTPDAPGRRPRYADRVSEPDDDDLYYEEKGITRITRRDQEITDKKTVDKTERTITVTMPRLETVEQRYEEEEELSEYERTEMELRRQVRTEQVTDLDEDEPKPGDEEEIEPANLSVASKVSRFLTASATAAAPPQPSQAPKIVEPRGTRRPSWEPEDSPKQPKGDEVDQKTYKTEELASFAVKRARDIFETIAKTPIGPEPTPTTPKLKTDVLGKASLFETKQVDEINRTRMTQRLRKSFTGSDESLGEDGLPKEKPCTDYTESEEDYDEEPVEQIKESPIKKTVPKDTTSYKPQFEKDLPREISPGRTFKTQPDKDRPKEGSPSRTFKPQAERDIPKESTRRPSKPTAEKPEAPKDKPSIRDDLYDEPSDGEFPEGERPKKTTPYETSPKPQEPTTPKTTDTDDTRRRNIFRDSTTPAEEEQTPKAKKTSVGSGMGREAFLKRMSKFASTEETKTIQTVRESPKLKPVSKFPPSKPGEDEPTRRLSKDRQSPSRKVSTDSPTRRISRDEPECRRSPARDSPKSSMDTYTRRPSKDQPSDFESPRRTPTRETPSQQNESPRRTDTYTRKTSKEIPRSDLESPRRTPTRDTPSQQAETPRRPSTDTYTRKTSRDRPIGDAESPRRTPTRETPTQARKPQDERRPSTDIARRISREFPKEDTTPKDEKPKGATFTRRPSKDRVREDEAPKKPLDGTFTRKPKTFEDDLPRAEDGYPRGSDTFTRRPSKDRQSPKRDSPMRAPEEDSPRSTGTYTRKTSTDRFKESSPSPRSSPAREIQPKRPDESPRRPSQDRPAEDKPRGSDTFTRRRSQPREEEPKKPGSAADALKPYLRTRTQDFQDDDNKLKPEDKTPKKLSSSRFDTFTKRDSSTTVTKDDTKTLFPTGVDRSPKKLSGSRFETFTKRDSATSVKATESVVSRTKATTSTTRRSVEREVETREERPEYDEPSRKAPRESPSRVDRKTPERTPEKIERRPSERMDRTPDRRTPDRRTPDRKTPDRREESPASYGEPVRKKPSKEVEDEPVRKASRPEEEEIEPRTSTRRRPSKDGSPRPEPKPEEEIPDQQRRRSSGGKFGVVLRQSSSVGSRVEALLSKVEKRTGTTTSTTVTLTPTKRRPSKGPDSGLEIEEIFDLEFLEQMLEKATDYDQRRRIRAQIRIVRRGEGRPESGKETPSREAPKEREPTRPSSLVSKGKPAAPSAPPEESDAEEERKGKPRRPSQTRESPEKVTTVPSLTRKPSRAEEVGGELTSPSVVAKLLPSSTTGSSPASRPSPAPSSAPKKNSLTSSSGLPREACPTDSITSSYGVGPTDESGRPLFGLRALRRPQQQAPDAVPSAPAPSPITQSREASLEPRPQSPERSDVRDSSGRPLFGLRAITISSTSKTTKEGRRVIERSKSPETGERPDSQSPSEDEEDSRPRKDMPSTSTASTTETSVHLRDLVRRHEQHARGNVPSQPVASQKPRAKLRDSFILPQQSLDDEEEDVVEEGRSRPVETSPASKTFPSALPSSVIESGKIVSERSCTLKSIIQKHEKNSDTEITNDKLNRRDSGLGAYTGQRPETTTVKVTSDVVKRPGILKKPKDTEVTETSITTSTGSAVRSQQTVSEKSGYVSLKKDVIQSVEDSEGAVDDEDDEEMVTVSSGKGRVKKGSPGRRPSNDHGEEAPSPRTTYSAYTTSSSSSSVARSGGEVERRRSSNSTPYRVDEDDGDSNDGIEVIRSPSDNRYSATTTTVTRRVVSGSESPKVVTTTTTVKKATGRPDEEETEVLVQDSRSNSARKKFEPTSAAPTSPSPSAAFPRVTRGGSVRALSQKFQQAAGTKTTVGEVVERRTVTSSSSRGVTTVQKEDSGNDYLQQIRRRSVENDRGSSPTSSRRSTEVSTVSRTRQPIVDEYDDDEVHGGESVTVEQRTVVVTNGSTGSRSFLGNQSKVTGVQDVLSRMREADNEGPTEGDTVEDSEARALLNKFLGAQVILQGMEPLINAQSPSLVRQVEKQRVQKKQESVSIVYSPDTDLEGIWDERRLRQLLESCSDYDGRRKIRARIRTVMAEQKVTAEIVAEGRLEAEREESSGRSKAIVSKQSDDGQMETSTTVLRSVQGHSEATSMSSSTESSVTKTEVHTKTSNYSATVTGKSRVSKAPPSKTMSPFAKFKQLDEQNAGSSPNSPKSPGGTGPLFKFTDPQLSRSASGVKDRLLYWCQIKTKEYKNIQIENFSTSWSNGLAFCALIHHFCPEAFDYDTLRPEERRKNFELAFRVADEKANIAPLLDVEDMVTMRKPDWKCVFTYVQSIYRRFKDED